MQYTLIFDEMTHKKLGIFATCILLGMKDVKTYLEVVRFFAKDRNKVAVSLLFAIAYVSLLAIPFALQGQSGAIFLLAVWAVLLNVFHFFVKFLSLRLSNNRVNAIRHAFVNHLSQSGLADNEHRGSSTRITLTSTAIEHISFAGAALYGQVISGVVALVLFVVVLAYLIGLMTFLFIPVAFVIWLVNQASLKRVKKNFEVHHANGKVINSEILNLSTNYLYYKSTRLFGNRAHQLYLSLKGFGESMVNIRTLQNISSFVNQSIVVLLFVLLAKNFKSDLNVGQVMIWTVFSFEFKRLLLSLFQSNAAVFQGGLSYSKIKELLLFGQSTENEQCNETKWESIYWDKLSFQYPASSKTQYFEAHTIRRGSRTWVKGPNGAGKTTLWKLVLGFYKPLLGKVKISPISEEVNPSFLRIGIVTEPVLMLTGKLWEFLGTEKLAKDEVITRVNNAGFGPFIEQIGDGYEHVLGIENKKLSKGQTKIIMFLQAILSNSEILVLDEPFATVDDYWCIKMADVITKLPIETTIIYMSHQNLPVKFDSVLELS